MQRGKTMVHEEQAQQEEPAFRILLAEDEATFREDIEAALRRRGYDVVAVASGAEALARLEAETFHLLVTDVKMPPPDGIELLRWVKRERPLVEVLVLTGQRELLEDPKSAREAIRDGAFDYLSKPVSAFDLMVKVERVRERWDLIAEKERLRRWASYLSREDLEEGRFESLIGTSKPVRELFTLARRAAATEAAILIRGESGTGKSVLAAAIHNHSKRSHAPFLKVNSGAIPENLLESELFGHEQGAFTGAVRRKQGLFEVAEGGTLFLDEIGDLPMAMQVKLLSAIEEKQFLRVGGTRPIRCDVRILAATHRDLEQGIREGTFREDLYYRINVFPLTIPPLRDRPEEIPLLVEHFLKGKGMDPERVRPEALRLLAGYRFPGNVRELENLIERAMILADGRELGAEHFPSLHRPDGTQMVATPEIPDDGLSMDEVEKRYILAALAKAEGNKSRAAALLGLSRRTLYSRMERHGIAP
ncbi:MAG: response regulator [Candidatus Eisenbacteria bacterium]|nr:response regulator [Candidatus Latescibacterota bacterium]MBD3303493.1 response regulator [Candidatus Eisenbacteria bacterium]